MWLEERDPARVVRMNIRHMKQRIASNEIGIEENEFHEKHETNELQGGLVVRLDPNLLQFLVDGRHEVKPEDEGFTLTETIKEHCANAYEPDAQLQRVTHDRDLCFEEVRDDAVVHGDGSDIAKGKETHMQHENDESKEIDL